MLRHTHHHWRFVSSLVFLLVGFLLALLAALAVRIDFFLFSNEFLALLLVTIRPVLELTLLRAVANWRTATGVRTTSRNSTLS